MFYYSVNSEYKPLKVVLLCRPHPKIVKVSNPQDVLHLAKIDYAAMEKEHEQLIELYRKLKINIFLIDPRKIRCPDYNFAFNIIFTRDHFMMTPRGAIICGMFSDIRQSEIKYAQKALKAAGVPVRMVIGDNGTFEGADALWVKHKLVIVGVGNRTNLQGFQQISKELKKDGIKCIPVQTPRGAIHLLGALQFIDADTALARVDLIGPETIAILRKNRVKIVRVPESFEVREKQAMNFVVIAPKTIIMPAGCPQIKKVYTRVGIKIAAEIAIPQFINAGGGLACATGVLKRA